MFQKNMKIFKPSKKDLERLIDLVKSYEEIAEIYYADMDIDITPIRLERYKKIGESLDKFKRKWGK